MREQARTPSPSSSSSSSSAGCLLLRPRPEGSRGLFSTVMWGMNSSPHPSPRRSSLKMSSVGGSSPSLSRGRPLPDLAVVLEDFFFGAGEEGVALGGSSGGAGAGGDGPFAGVLASLSITRDACAASSTSGLLLGTLKGAVSFRERRVATSFASTVLVFDLRPVARVCKQRVVRLHGSNPGKDICRCVIIAQF